jgi:hypothetical protein
MKTLSDDQLVSETRRLVREELRIGLAVLEHLREVERRRLHIARGHSSLFAFCLRELDYSESQAQLRIDAMRALRDTPAIQERVATGELNVTAVAKVQQFLRRERKLGGKNYSHSARVELFDRVQGKSSREVEQLLAPPAVTHERERVASPTHVELKLVIPNSLHEKLERLKALHSH